MIRDQVRYATVGSVYRTERTDVLHLLENGVSVGVENDDEGKTPG